MGSRDLVSPHPDVAAAGRGRLILITGAQAAGKTTVGAALAARLPRSIHVDSDAIAAFVVSGYARYDVPPSEEAVLQLRLRQEASVDVADRYLRNGFDAVISDNLYGHHLDHLVAFGRRLGPVYVVVLDPDVETIRAREDGRGKVAYSASVTPELLVAAVRAETRRDGLWLDNSSEAPEATVDRILDGLDRGLVT